MVLIYIPQVLLYMATNLRRDTTERGLTSEAVNKFPSLEKRG